MRLKADDITTSNMEIPAKDDRKGKLLGFNATTGDPEASDNKDNWNAAYNDKINSAHLVVLPLPLPNKMVVLLLHPYTLSTYCGWHCYW